MKAIMNDGQVMVSRTLISLASGHKWTEKGVICV